MIPIADPDDPRVADYRNVPDAELLRRLGLFVAESRLVVQLLLQSSRFRTRSVLVSEAAYEALRGTLGPLEDRVAVFVCPKKMMEAISGYNIYRGCLALGERPAPMSVPALLAMLPRARAIVALEAIGNADNVGAVFRNARAFAVDGLIAGPSCCDPLYRKAIRVSIGASLVVPYAVSPARVESSNPPAADPAEHEGRAGRRADSTWTNDLISLKTAGFTLAALTPACDAVELDEFVARGLPRNIALLVGHEGEGLSSEAQEIADIRVRIPMAPGVDSVNLATATGIALYRICR